MKTWYDQNSKLRKFDEGDEVLVLLPTCERSLESLWQGPFKIIEKLSDLDYLVEVGKGQNKRRQKYHINMLKKWKTREEISCFSDNMSEDNNDFMVQYNPKQTETYEDVEISKELTQEQTDSLNQLLMEFNETFSDVPGVTQMVRFEIDTGDSKPISTKPYPIPHKFREETDKEITQLLDDGIIVESDSEWCSPVVVRQKFRDGVPKGIRMCIDFREINKVTLNNPFPLPRTEDLLEKLSTSQYITTLDLTKGYYQIKCADKTRNRTAFIVGNNKYEFTRMPFGTRNASGIFQRLIQKILYDCREYAENFIDDVVIHSNSWSDHEKHLRSVLAKIREAGLTAKPSKCCVGHASVQFMGHLVGKGVVHPLQSKIEVIRNYPIPKTKKQDRLGAILSQYHGDHYCPMCFANRELLPNMFCNSEINAEKIIL